MSKRSFPYWDDPKQTMWGLWCDQCNDCYDWSYDNEPVYDMRVRAEKAGWLLVKDIFAPKGHRTKDVCRNCAWDLRARGQLRDTTTKG